jgi:hypothetical protein
LKAFKSNKYFINFKDIKAVSDEVLITIPIVVFVMGIISTIFSIRYFYQWVPVLSHHQDQEQDENRVKSTKPSQISSLEMRPRKQQ